MPKISHVIHHIHAEFEKPMIMLARILAKVQPNKVVFLTNTLTYTCNPKYISEALVKKFPNVDVVWLTGNDRISQNDYPKNVKTIPLHSFKGFYTAYSAKIWVDNGIAFSAMFDRKPDQIHIQTMHGSLGIKRLDRAITSRQKHYWGRKEIYRESKFTDYVITNSKFEEDVFKTVFWKNVPMYRLGHARTDVLFSQDLVKIKKLRQSLQMRYAIPENHKLVLYAPTHRAGFFPDIDTQGVIDALEKRFGGTFSFLIRFHIRSEDLNIKSDADLRLYNVSDYPDIQELMLVCDVGITDYSSWIFDYVNTKKPGFIYAPDLEQYNNKTGFYYSLEEAPFPIATTNTSLCEQIVSFDNKDYCQKVDSFLQEKEAVDDGYSADRVAEMIASLLKL